MAISLAAGGNKVSTTTQLAAPPRLRKLTLLPLVAATYFMVSGGPYGLEDIVGQAGYLRALLLLAIVPLIWSLPTALMIGELASAIPEEGGFYRWVSRAFGPFWGFQEAWLSLSASVFDMAIYPALAVAYLGQLSANLTAGHRGLFWSLAIVLICIAWNLRGAHSVGQGSIGMFALLLTPFLGIIIYGAFHAASAPFGPRNLAAIGEGNMTTALLFVLWNCMGWDNASTIAREVKDPRRNYIRAMVGAVALVTISYILPIAIVAMTGIPATSFATGAWVDAARDTRWPGGWSDPCDRRGGRWRDYGRGDVQCADAFLCAGARGDGARRNVAEAICAAYGQWRPLGCGDRLRAGMGAGARA